MELIHKRSCMRSYRARFFRQKNALRRKRQRQNRSIIEEKAELINHSIHKLVLSDEDEANNTMINMQEYRSNNMLYEIVEMKSEIYNKIHSLNDKDNTVIYVEMKVLEGENTHNSVENATPQSDNKDVDEAKKILVGQDNVISKEMAEAELNTNEAGGLNNPGENVIEQCVFDTKYTTLIKLDYDKEPPLPYDNNVPVKQHSFTNYIDARKETNNILLEDQSILCNEELTMVKRSIVGDQSVFYDHTKKELIDIQSDCLSNQSAIDNNLLHIENMGTNTDFFGLNKADLENGCFNSQEWITAEELVKDEHDNKISLIGEAFNKNILLNKGECNSECLSKRQSIPVELTLAAQNSVLIEPQHTEACFNTDFDNYDAVFNSLGKRKSTEIVDDAICKNSSQCQILSTETNSKRAKLSFSLEDKIFLDTEQIFTDPVVQYKKNNSEEVNNNSPKPNINSFINNSTDEMSTSTAFYSEPVKNKSYNLLASAQIGNDNEKTVYAKDYKFCQNVLAEHKSMIETSYVQDDIPLETQSNILNKREMYINDLSTNEIGESSVMLKKDSNPSIFGSNQDNKSTSITNNNVCLAISNNISARMETLMKAVAETKELLKKHESQIKCAIIANERQTVAQQEKAAAQMAYNESKNGELAETRINGLHLEFSRALNTFNKSDIASINLHPLAHNIDKLGKVFEQWLIKNEKDKAELERMKKNDKLKDNALIEANQTVNSLKTRTEMLEENIDYLNKQNEKLKTRNHIFLQAFNSLKAHFSNIKSTFQNIDGYNNELLELFNKLENSYNDKFVDMNSGLLDLQCKVSVLKKNIEMIEIQRCKTEFDTALKKTVDFYESKGLSESNQTIAMLEEIQNLKRIISDLKEENARINYNHQEIKEEYKLKDNYAKELEKSVEELMKSNNFYEDQLLHVDETIKSLKDAKMATTIDLSTEIEKIKRFYIKENGLLKLRIEELESNQKGVEDIYLQ